VLGRRLQWLITFTQPRHLANAGSIFAVKARSCGHPLQSQKDFSTSPRFDFPYPTHLYPYLPRHSREAGIHSDLQLAQQPAGHSLRDSLRLTKQQRASITSANPH